MSTDFPSDPRIVKAFQGKPLRRLWPAAQEHQIMMLRDQNMSEGLNTERVFNKGLERLLDDFYKDCNKYPRHNSRQLQQALDKIVETTRAYKSDIRTSCIGTGGRGLIAILEEIDKELERRAKFYKLIMPRPS